MSIGKEEITPSEETLKKNEQAKVGEELAEEEVVDEELAENAELATETDAENEATEEQTKEASQEASPVPPLAQPEDGKKKKEKDPMLELVDDLNDFVKQTNEQITNFIKEKGKAVWDKLQDTEPMKTLNGALDEAKQFAKDKVDEGVEKVTNSEAVQSAKAFVNDIKDKVSDAFSDLANAAANKVADTIRSAISPSTDTPTAQMSTPTDSTQDPTTEPMKSLESSTKGHEDGLKPKETTPPVNQEVGAENVQGISNAM